MPVAEESEAIRHPDIHGGNSVDEPPLEMRELPETDVPPTLNLSVPAQPYDDGSPLPEK
jgi:hypothetical protein